MVLTASFMLGIFNFFFGPKGGQMESYQQNKMQNTEKTIYQFTMNDIDGKPVSLSAYKGKVVIIVILLNQAHNFGKVKTGEFVSNVNPFAISKLLQFKLVFFVESLFRTVIWVV